MRILFPLLLAVAVTWPVSRVRESAAPFYAVSEGRVKGQCTAVAIRPDVMLTASHCFLMIKDATDWFVGEHRVFPVEVDTSSEGLAVVRADRAILRPMSLGRKPRLGDEVLITGFGVNSPELFVFPGVVWSHTMKDPGDGKGPFMWLSFDAIEGMSGGPIVNRRGELVSLVIGGYASMKIGYNATWDQVAEKVRKYAR